MSDCHGNLWTGILVHLLPFFPHKVVDFGFLLKVEHRLDILIGICFSRLLLRERRVLLYLEVPTWHSSLPFRRDGSQNSIKIMSIVEMCGSFL